LDRRHELWPPVDVFPPALSLVPLVLTVGRACRHQSKL
jgi:hypothetical protein